jgi:hypothetical protein
MTDTDHLTISRKDRNKEKPKARPDPAPPILQTNAMRLANDNPHLSARRSGADRNGFTDSHVCPVYRRYDPQAQLSRRLKPGQSYLLRSQPQTMRDHRSSIGVRRRLNIGDMGTPIIGALPHYHYVDRHSKPLSIRLTSNDRRQAERYRPSE